MQKGGDRFGHPPLLDYKTVTYCPAIIKENMT